MQPTDADPPTLSENRTEQALRQAALAVSGARGADVFPALMRYLGASLGVDHALISVPAPEKPGYMQTLAFYSRGEIVGPAEYELKGSPCELVLGKDFHFIGSKVYRQYPKESEFVGGRVDGYAAVPLFDSNGEAIGLLAVLHGRPLADAALVESMLRIFAARAAAEIERQQSEEQRRQSEESYRTIFEASEDAIFVHDWDTGAILDVNPRACETYGYTREEFRGIDVGAISAGEHPYTLEEAAKIIERAKRGERVRVEWHRRNRDGSLHWDEVYLRAATIAGKKRVLAFTREITERKEREQALSKNESQLRATIQAALDCVIGMDAAGNITEFNRAAEQCFGYRREQVIGRPLADLIIPPEYREAHRAGLHRYRVTGEGPFLRQRVELEAMRADGSMFPVELAIGVAKGGDGDLFIGYLRDITERKRAEERLRASEEQYRAIFNASVDGMVLWNPEAMIVDVNPAFCRMVGCTREELIASAPFEFVPVEGRPHCRAFFESMRGLPSQSAESVAMRKDGTTFHAEVHAVQVHYQGRPHYLALIRDVSERKRAEEEHARLEAQLRQAQKMEAIGHLSGGIAHDFNNILTTILGYIAMAQERLGPTADEKLARYLERALRSGRQARDLIQQLLTFSRGRRGEARALQPAPVVKESIKFLRSTLPSSIEFETRFDDSLPPILLDPVQLEQILMNLCLNARDAMERAGRLSVALEGAHGQGRVCSSCRKAADGDFVELAVADTGCGIAPDVLDRIFEPFFTTKEPGQGSGMGLSVVHGIVHEHGGHVIVESLPGGGTTFRVLFPVAEQARLAPPAAPEQTTPAGRRLLAGRVLLVDDEPAVAEFMSELLTGWGLDVTVRHSSREAKALFLSDPRQFDLVITDQTMPRPTGLELASALLAVRPNLPVVLYTGYAERLTEQQAKNSGIRAFITKPVDVDTFYTTLESLLTAVRAA